MAHELFKGVCQLLTGSSASRSWTNVWPGKYDRSLKSTNIYWAQGILHYSSNRPRNTFVFLPLAAFKTVFHDRSKAAKHFKRRRYQIISDCKITSRKREWAVYPLSHVHVCACVYMCIHMCKCTSMIAFSDHFAWRHKKVVVQCKKKKNLEILIYKNFTTGFVLVLLLKSKAAIVAPKQELRLLNVSLPLLDTERMHSCDTARKNSHLCCSISNKCSCWYKHINQNIKWNLKSEPPITQNKK